MFEAAILFNQDLSTWNVENVESMGRMFDGASAFNQDLSAWNVVSVTDMSDMFNRASLFNQDLSTWNVGSVRSMWSMFNGASSFDQNMCAWGAKLLALFPLTLIMFLDTACPLMDTPSLRSIPPGPFCYDCSNDTLPSPVDNGILPPTSPAIVDVLSSTPSSSNATRPSPVDDGILPPTNSPVVDVPSSKPSSSNDTLPSPVDNGILPSTNFPVVDVPSSNPSGCEQVASSSSTVEVNLNASCPPSSLTGRPSGDTLPVSECTSVVRTPMTQLLLLVIAIAAVR